MNLEWRRFLLGACRVHLIESADHEKSESLGADPAGFLESLLTQDECGARHFEPETIHAVENLPPHLMFGFLKMKDNRAAERQ